MIQQNNANQSMAELGAAAVIGGVPQGLFTGGIKPHHRSIEEEDDCSESESEDEDEIDA
jgi:hypothetical protein